MQDQNELMPTYDYRCLRGHLYKELRSINDIDSKSTCPKCEDEGQRLITAPAVTFKGTGFYSTDKNPSPFQ